MHTAGCPSSQAFEDGTEETVAEVHFRDGVGILHVCGAAAAEGHAQRALIKVYQKHSIAHIRRTEVRWRWGQRDSVAHVCRNFRPS